jgi:hypothetical protein
MDMQPGVCVIDLFGMSYDGLCRVLCLPAMRFGLDFLRLHRQILPT